MSLQNSRLGILLLTKVQSLEPSVVFPLSRRTDQFSGDLQQSGLPDFDRAGHGGGGSRLHDLS